MKLQTNLPSGKMTFTAIKLTPRAVPKFRSGKLGRTWDSLCSIVINGETIRCITDSTWGTCHYFKYNNVWYKLANRQNVKIDNGGENVTVLDFYAFDDLGYNCPVEIVKE